MRYYSKTTGCTYLEGVHTEIPRDAVQITEDSYQAVIANPAPGKIRSHDADGLPILIDPPQPTPRALLDSVKSEMRAMRRDMLDAVTGIGFRANVVGNAALAQEAAQVSQQLLDITDDPALNDAQTYDDMRAAGMAAYRRIADSVSPGLRSAFKELEK